MKKAIIWIALMAMNFLTFSQSLTPKIRQQDKDTLFCFTLTQSRAIAKELSNGRYCDSINSELEKEVELLDGLICNKDSCISILQISQANRDKIILNKDKTINELDARLMQTEKKYKHQLWQKRVLALSIIVLGITSIIIK